MSQGWSHRASWFTDGPRLHSRWRGCISDHAVWGWFSPALIWPKKKWCPRVHTWGLVLTFSCSIKPLNVASTLVWRSVFFAIKPKGRWHKAINCQLNGFHKILLWQTFERIMVEAPEIYWLVLNLITLIRNKYIWTKSSLFHHRKKPGIQVTTRMFLL